MSNIKNLDNLDEAINSINSGLSPEIWVDTNGTEVYAVKGSERVVGIKSGDKFIITLPSIGTWTVYATLEGRSKSSVVEINKAIRIDTKLMFVPLDKTFANCTDEEFLLIAQALQSGEILVDNLTDGWTVGATKTVSLGAFTSYPGGSATTQEAQTAELVILHKKSNEVCAGKQFADNSVPSFIIGFTDNVCKSYYYNGASNIYANSLLKTVENNIYNALPTDIKSAFKQFKVITGVFSGKTIATSNQYFASPAARELFGGSDSASEGRDTGYSIKAEYDTLGSNAQFDHYKTKDNRKHTKYSSDSWWWERSPEYGLLLSACHVNSTGSPGSTAAEYGSGVSPFGCI